MGYESIALTGLSYITLFESRIKKPEPIIVIAVAHQGQGINT